MTDLTLVVTPAPTPALAVTPPPSPTLTTSTAPLRIADEGTLLPSESVLNFTGAGVTAADNPTTRRTDVTIPGGLTNPMVTNGDSLYGGALGAPVRLGPGPVDYVWTRIAGNAIGWRAPQPAFAEQPPSIPPSGAYAWPALIHYLIIPPLTGDLTITLPSPYDAYVLGVELLAKATVLNGHTLTFVNPDGAIDAGGSYALSADWGAVRFVPDTGEGIWYVTATR